MKRLTLFLLLTFIALVSYKAEAGVIIYHNGQTFNTVENLPEDCTIDGKHVNLAVMYDQFGLFWLPVWNYGTPEYILIADDEQEYWETDKEILEQLKTDFSIKVPNEPSPSLWNKIGLKPILIILVIVLVWSMLTPKKDEENDPSDHNHTNPYKTT